MHQIEAEKIPPMEPNEPTDLRNIALNTEFGEKAIWRNDLLPRSLPVLHSFISGFSMDSSSLRPCWICPSSDERRLETDIFLLNSLNSSPSVHLDNPHLRHGVTWDLKNLSILSSLVRRYLDKCGPLQLHHQHLQQSAKKIQPLWDKSNHTSVRLSCQQACAKQEA